ncbi:MAG: methyltransferase [Sphingobium sp.]
MRFLLIAFLAAVPTAALAQAPSPPSAAAAPALDPAWKVPEVIAFMGLKPGQHVADIFSGRFAAPFAEAVGPKGKVYAILPAETVKLRPEKLSNMRALAAQSPNIIVSADPIAAPLPKKLDAVFIRQNYHDLYDKFMGPADVAAFNRAVYAALKPGGVYVILDHTAAAGSGISATETLHRIDPDRVKADALAAGFTFDGGSDVLANSADDHGKGVFDPAIRGRTDQFLLRFRKPK